MADSGFAKGGGGPWREGVYNGGPGHSPQRGPGQAPGGAEPLVGSVGPSPHEAISFSSFFVQKMGQMMAKVKNLNDNSTPCLRQTATTSFGQWGRGTAARSAHT